MLNPTQAYYGASFDTLTNITLPAGSSWWILDAKDGFYKLFIACQARYLWVPAEAVSANFDPVWNGASLPDAGSPSD
ncbi:MAG: hypothetical protein IPK19_38570 [Chloroflexi bacterium]|nr:hypothetical protein [Chloroflexota bacterium]